MRKRRSARYPTSLATKARYALLLLSYLLSVWRETADFMPRRSHRDKAHTPCSYRASKIASTLADITLPIFPSVSDSAPTDDLIGTRTFRAVRTLCDPKRSFVSVIDKLSASGHRRLSCAVATRTGLRSRRRDLQFPVWSGVRNAAV